MAKDNRPTPDERSGRLPRRVPGAAGHSPGVFRRAHLPAPARHPDSDKAAHPDQPPAGPPPALDTLPRRVPGASPIQAPPPRPGRPPPPDDDLTQPLAVTPADPGPADPARADAAPAADTESAGPPRAPNPRATARGSLGQEPPAHRRPGSGQADRGRSDPESSGTAPPAAERT